MLASLAALLTGCDACDVRPPRERALAAYVAAIDPATPVPPHSPSLQRLPAQPQRSVEIPRRTTDIAGFLGLQGCALGERIGERNSGLGRVMMDSQRWVYEVGFLRDAAQCMSVLDADAQVELAAVVAAKQSDLPAVISNAIWAGPEIQHLLALSGRDLDPGLGAAAPAATDALGLLRRLAADPSIVTSADLEGALHTLRGSTVGGDVLRALDLLAHFLDAAAARLEAAAADPDCPRLRDVFERRYAPEVQPHLARTHRAAGPLLTALSDLYEETAAHAALPELAAWHARIAPLHQRYTTALARHTAAWQVVGQRCSFLPTAPP